jgi:hypothetical protein
MLQRFRADADRRYADLSRSAGRLLKDIRRRRLSPERLELTRQRYRLLERTLRLERRRDYFRAPGRQAVEAALRTTARELGIGKPATTITGRAHAVGD